MLEIVVKIDATSLPDIAFALAGDELWGRLAIRVLARKRDRPFAALNASKMNRKSEKIKKEH